MSSSGDCPLWEARVAKVSKEIQEKHVQTVQSLSKIWRDIGVKGSARVDRLESFRSHVLGLFEEMVEEEENNKLLIVQRIEQHMKDISKLRKELSGEHLTGHDEGWTLDEAPLYQVEKCLREKGLELLKIKEEKLKIVKDLADRFHEVNFRLGKQYTPYSGGLTEFEIDAFKCRVHLLEIEQKRLQALYEQTRETIVEIIKGLRYMPKSGSFEELVVCMPIHAFVLSPDNMVALKKLHQTMEQKLIDAKATAAELRERLSNLWERLEISAEYRENFLASHYGHCSKALDALKGELQRCEALKRANIQKFVEQLREEIVSWWERCCYSEDQRNAFLAFRYTDFNEDVLELHELEVNKLKAFYETHRDIFQLVEERNEQRSKMLELENRANDPNRLFNNRGGQLLREERERNALAKALPKIEKELMEHLTAYEKENRTPFLINGANVRYVIEKENQDRSALKELQKHQKKVTRSHQLEVEAKLGSKPVTPTSVRRGKLAPQTPSMLGSSQKTFSVAPRSAPANTFSATLKRKADNSPHTNVSKKTKGKSTEKSSSRSGNKSGPRFSTSKIRRYGKGPTKKHDVSSSRARRDIMSQMPTDNCSIASGIGAYSDFQNQLELMSAEKACRSSVVPRNCLRELTTRVTKPSSVSSTTKMTLTPGRVTTVTQSTLTPHPMKPPRRNGVAGTPTPVRRTSTRINLRSPSVKSPAVTSNARLTTPRSRLPIVF